MSALHLKVKSILIKKIKIEQETIEKLKTDLKNQSDENLSIIESKTSKIEEIENNLTQSISKYESFKETHDSLLVKHSQELESQHQILQNEQKIIVEKNLEIDNYKS